MYNLGGEGNDLLIWMDKCWSEIKLLNRNFCDQMLFAINYDINSEAISYYISIKIW